MLHLSSRLPNSRLIEFQEQVWPSDLYQKLVNLNPAIEVINGGLFLSFPISTAIV